MCFKRQGFTEKKSTVKVPILGCFLLNHNQSSWKLQPWFSFSALSFIQKIAIALLLYAQLWLWLSWKTNLKLWLLPKLLCVCVQTLVCLFHKNIASIMIMTYCNLCIGFEHIVLYFIYVSLSHWIESLMKTSHTSSSSSFPLSMILQKRYNSYSYWMYVVNKTQMILMRSIFTVST